jgi:hypothetical protein
MGCALRMQSGVPGARWHGWGRCLSAVPVGPVAAAPFAPLAAVDGPACPPDRNAVSPPRRGGSGGLRGPAGTSVPPPQDRRNRPLSARIPDGRCNCLQWAQLFDVCTRPAVSAQDKSNGTPNRRQAPGLQGRLMGSGPKQEAKSRLRKASRGLEPKPFLYQWLGMPPRKSRVHASQLPIRHELPDSEGPPVDTERLGRASLMPRLASRRVTTFSTKSQAAYCFFLGKRVFGS